MSSREDVHMNKNVFEKRAEELQKYKRVDESIFPEDQAEIKARSARRAPYIAIVWLEKFFDLNHRQRIDKVDTEFVRLNIMGSGHESQIISALRFLGLVDENGAATQKLASLRVLGEDFKRNLAPIVREAYSDLISTIVLDSARSENLINFFVQRYNYSSTGATSAARLFIWLASQTDIPISDELGNLGAKSPQQIRPRLQTVQIAATKSKYEKGQNVLPTNASAIVQATVNITLDKDTPKELWDRVLALLGEKRKEEEAETE